MNIGTLTINSSLALAPMAGVTDVAFRQICAELGAGYTITELISSKALCYHDKKTLSLLQQFPGEHPAAVQVFGSDPICMAEAAQIALEQEARHKLTYVWVKGHAGHPENERCDQLAVAQGQAHGGRQGR